MYYKKLFLILFSIPFSLLAGSATITDCDDISLIKSAYANDKGSLIWQNSSRDTLVMNSWRC